MCIVKTTGIFFECASLVDVYLRSLREQMALINFYVESWTGDKMQECLAAVVAVRLWKAHWQRR